MKIESYVRVAVVGVLIVAQIGYALAADTLTYYVASGAGEDAIGTKAKPFATLVQARDAIRASRRGKGEMPAVVLIAPGVYDQRFPLILEKQDSSTTYRSERPHEANLTGGIAIDLKNLPAVKDKALLKRLPGATRSDVLVVDLAQCVPGWKPEESWPDAFRGYAGWPEVFVGGKPFRLARWPNNGYAKIGKVLDQGSQPRLKEKPDRPGAFSFKESEPAAWDTSQEIYLGGYWCHAWYDEVLRVKSIDAANKVVHFAAPHHYGIGGNSRGPYYSLNVLETLDQPGEYVYDRKAAKIYLLPVPEAGNDCTIGLSKHPLITINGAKDVRLEGFQMEAGRAMGVEIKNCIGTVLDNCVIRNFPKFGVQISGGERCGVTRSELYGLGQGGISMQGGDRATLRPSRHFVTDCEIHHYARLIQTYQPAVRLAGVGQYAAYNYIHHAPHQAMQFGGNDHLIEHNRIESVLLDTGDAGAIYCGRDWTLQGNVIQMNWFSNLGKGLSHHNWAIYPDDQASGVTARHNIVVNCPSGFLFGGGRDSVIEGNLFVKVGDWPIRFDCRGLGWAKKFQETLQKRLAAVPSDKEPWPSRFSTLVGLSTNEMRNWPANNLINGNIAVSSSADNIDAKVKQAGEVADTVSVKSDWVPRLLDGKVVFPAGGPELPAAFKGLTVGPRGGK